MKKRLNLTLIAILVTLALAGCLNSPTDTSGTTLEVVDSSGNQLTIETSGYTKAYLCADPEKTAKVIIGGRAVDKTKTYRADDFENAATGETRYEISLPTNGQYKIAFETKNNTPCDNITNLVYEKGKGNNKKITVISISYKEGEIIYIM